MPEAGLPAGGPVPSVDGNAGRTAARAAGGAAGPAASAGSLHGSPAADDPAWLPLTDAQRAVWLDLRLGADPLAYVLGGCYRLDITVDLALVRQSLRVLVARHEALRLRVDPAQPRQRLAEGGALPLQVHRLDGALPPAQAEAAARSLLQPLMAQPLALDDSPLMRIDLAPLPGSGCLLLWRLHHLVADASTVNLVLMRWLQTYQALSDNAPDGLPPGSAFTRLLAQDTAYAASAQAEADLAHWQRRLAQLPAPLFLAITPDMNGATGPGGPGGSVDRVDTVDTVDTGGTVGQATVPATLAPRRWQLTGADHQRWRQACAQAGVTEQRAMLGLLALTLGTRFDRRDLCIGLALHRRDLQSQLTVGMLAGALPVRCQWPADSTLRGVLRQLSDQLDTDYRHQRAPLDAIARALGLAGSGQGGLFDVSLSYTTENRREHGALFAPILDTQRLLSAAIVPVSLGVLEDLSIGEMQLDLVCSPAHLTAPEVDSLADALQRTLVQFCRDSQQPVASLEPTGPAERQRLLVDLQTPPATWPLPDDTLPQAFARQASATLDALALIDADARFTYAQVDAASQALAQRLRQALDDRALAGAAAAEPVVAVALPRSAHTVIALLAILRAGAVYLPLDDSHPTARLQYMLDDSRAALLIDGGQASTAALQATRLAGWPSPGSGTAAMAAVAKTADMAETAEPAEAAEAADTAGTAGPAAGPAASPDRLAYVIYTSGSSGQPKPVGVSHRATLNLHRGRQGHDPVQPGDRVLAAISVGFDVSIVQLLLPLLRGACIVVAPPLRSLDAAQFWALVAQHQVAHINSVPSFIDTVSSALASQPPAARYRGLKRLMLGGEVLTGALAARLQALLPETQIVNVYGPTETCIEATAYAVPMPGASPAATPATDILIGRPLPNYRCHVLDSLGRLLPVGVVGELCIAGPCLARGYLGRPGATAERFVADPFAAAPDQRLYRTGDLARWCADGQLAFLGRRDQQLKIRGHRIEAGEVEAVLRQHPAVAQAAVLARPDAQGRPVLVAYLVAHQTPATETPDTPDTLPTWLAQRLPDALLPTHRIWLPALPLTPNGKLDLRALPDPVAAATPPLDNTLPEGPAETVLATLWAELLGRTSVGRQDHFFALGGHSLLAITLVERLRQQGWQLQVRQVFEQPVLAALAQRLQVDAAVGNHTGTDTDTQASTDTQAGHPIPPGTQRITPDMLPLVALTQPQIDRITADLPGGAAQVQDIYPLTALQQGLLFQHLQQAEGDVYLSPSILAFRRQADLLAFVDALRQVQRRHDSLRTSLAWDGLDHPVQVVWREAPLAWHQAPASPPGADALASLRARVDPRRLRLDLTRAPLLHLVSQPDPDHQRWLLALCAHHLVLDQVSTAIVMAELTALRQGVAAAALPAPVPMRDVVRQGLAPGRAAADEAFFRQMLAGVDQPTAPYGLLAVNGDAADAATARQWLPDALAAAARQVAQAHGVNLASLLHLAWAAVLSATSGRADVVLGTVLSGRLGGDARLTQSVGLLINTLPLRVDLRRATLAQALATVHQGLAGLMAHEQASLAQAQRCSGVAAPTPLFSALINCRTHATGQGLAGPDTSLNPQANQALGAELLEATPFTAYPVTLAVDDDGQRLLLTAQTVAPVPPADLAALVQSALGQLVATLQSRPDTPCRQLEVLDAAQRARILAFNPPPTPQEPALLHQRVRAMAAAHPDLPAVVDGALTLSYAELDARSDHLARHLRQALRQSWGQSLQGQAPTEPVVAVALPRSAGTVLAFLAILKAGAVYLPLDAAHPPRRLQHMLDEQAAALLIDEPDSATAVLVAPRLGASIWALGDPTPARHADDDPPATADPERLAYVIYTSGSSGLPKPVGVSHRATLNLDHARQSYAPVQAGDRVLAGIAVGFDPSIAQLMVTLLRGATVVIAPPLATLEADRFWALVAQQRVTHINSVPSFFDAVLAALPAPPDRSGQDGQASQGDAPPPHPCPQLRHVVLGGEGFSTALAARLQQRLPGTQIVNVYGPTEATIEATCHPVPAAVPGAAAAPGEHRANGQPGSPDSRPARPVWLPIGRPLPNYRVYVVDAANRLAPVGVAGELCIAGAGLARGYLGHAALTAERFVPDPFSAEPDARMYRSGDLARWRSDGLLEFLGRADRQVKVRGQRIELGEVEACLLGHPGVRQAAVLARPDASGQTRLLAWVVPAQPAPEPAALQAWLAERLPDAMRPASLQCTAALPLTTNGKLDEAALLRSAPSAPATAAGAAQQGAAAALPVAADALDAALLQAWQQVFGRTGVGLDDDFFSLGGDSLLAIRVVAACRKAVADAAPGMDAARLDLQALLARPTLRGLAQGLRGAGGHVAADGGRSGPDAAPGAGTGAPPGTDPTVPLSRPPGHPPGQPAALVPLRAQGSRPPLFCVHPHNGMAWCFLDLVRALPATQPVWGLQARGLAAGEEPLATVQAMASDYVQALRQVQPDGPYQLLGYSAGGVIAWEMARQLRDAGQALHLLVLVDAPLPDGGDHPLPDADEMLAEANRLLGRDGSLQLPRDADRMQDLLQRLGLAALPGTEGLPDSQAEHSEAGTERLLDTVRHVVAAVRRYAPQPADWPVLQLRALRRVDPAPDWSVKLARPADTHDLATDHLGIVAAPMASTLARLLLPRLA